MKKEGKIDPNTGAMWVRNTLHQRFELRCTYKMTDEIGASKQCLYRKRPDRYNEHPHFFSLKKDVQHKITEMYMPFKVTPIVAKAAALLNISANAASSAPFKEMIQELAIYGYECAKNNKNINIHDYSDKDVNSSIIQLANKRREEKLKIFQEYGYCSLILDAGTVRSFHTVEIMLMLPGLTKPLLYSTHSLEKGNIPEYKQLVLNQILELANLGIILTGICGDNLPAQKNALDHKYNNSLQDEANHIRQNRLLEQSLMNGINKDDEIHNNSITKNTITDQINKVKNNIENNTICLLYNPCLNHVIHLAFNDSQEFDESLQTCVKVLYLYKEFFNEDIILKHQMITYIMKMKHMNCQIYNLT